MNKSKNKSNTIIMWIFIIIIIVIIIIGGYSCLKNNSSQTVIQNYNSSESIKSSNAVTQITTTAITTNTKVESLKMDSTELYSSYAILLRDGQVVYSKNAEDKMYPASLTKIMTALLVLENEENLNNKLLLKQEVCDYAKENEASVAGFIAGQEVTIEDLLYGLMLPSGAECSMTLANYISGSEEEFAQLMNKKANEIGMKSTNFVNASGLHDDNHFSTAYDIALLTEYAIKNKEFRKIFTTKSYSTYPYDDLGSLTFNSTMFSSLDASSFINGEILGGKTGFTDQAGLCLASLASIDDHEYILVTAGAEGNHYTEPFHIKDALKVYKVAKEFYKLDTESDTQNIFKSDVEYYELDKESDAN